MARRLTPDRLYQQATWRQLDRVEKAQREESNDEPIDSLRDQEADDPVTSIPAGTGLEHDQRDRDDKA